MLRRTLLPMLAAALLHGCGGDSGATTSEPVLPPLPEEPGRPRAARLDLTPDSVTLGPGEPARFEAVRVLEGGDSAAVAVVWTATGGVVDGAGGYTAGATPGTFQVIASDSAGALADTATVTVRVPPGPHDECAAPGAAWIWCDDFEQDRLGRYFDYKQDNGSFVRAAGVGTGGSHGMRARFARGQVSAGALQLAVGRTPQAAFRPVDAGTADYRELYWRVYVRYQPGWVGGGGDKVSRVVSFSSPTTWAYAMKAMVWSGQQSYRNYLELQPVSGTDLQGRVTTTKYNDFSRQEYLRWVRGGTPLFDAAHVGRWYCLEAHVRLNDPGLSNGVFELWIDGRPEAASTGLNFVDTFTRYGINAVFLENYWNAGSPAAQERYFDRFVVSTRRIGC